MSSVRSGEAAETDRHVPQCFRFVLIFQLHFIQCSVSFATSQRSSTSLSVCFGVSEILVGGMKAKLYFLSVLLGISTGTPVSGFFCFFCLLTFAWWKVMLMPQFFFFHTENRNQDGVQRYRDGNSPATPATECREGCAGNGAGGGETRDECACERGCLSRSWR